MIKTEQGLLEYISLCSPLDAIVVEGYDGVGKGRVLDLISDFIGVVPYRPDYNLWQKHDHRYLDRWKVSGFFWDVYSHFFRNNENLNTTMLFDRGVLSGAVYNHDDNIAVDYKKMLRGMKVLHILVTCSEEDYKNFADVRDSMSPAHYAICKDYTFEYRRLLELSEVDYVVYENHYNQELAKQLSMTCGGCGHYSYGYCQHPDVYKKVNSTDRRCEFSRDEEVQDRDVAEMHCL